MSEQRPPLPLRYVEELVARLELNHQCYQSTGMLPTVSAEEFKCLLEVANDWLRMTKLLEASKSMVAAARAETFSGQERSMRVAGGSASIATDSKSSSTEQ